MQVTTLGYKVLKSGKFFFLNSKLSLSQEFYVLIVKKYFLRKLCLKFNSSYGLIRENAQFQNLNMFLAASCTSPIENTDTPQLLRETTRSNIIMTTREAKIFFPSNLIARPLSGGNRVTHR